MAFFSRSQSAAVKIVDPNTQDEQKPPTRKDSVQRQCRNIMIYGSCKFQDRGCHYYHPPSTEGPQVASPPDLSVATGLSAQAVNAPVFIPKAAGALISNATSPPTSASRQSSLTSPSPPSPPAQTEYPGYQAHDSYDDYQVHGDSVMDTLANQMDELGQPYPGDASYSHEYNPHLDPSYYSLPSPVFVRQPLNYHLYTTTTPSALGESTSSGHFVPPSAELRKTLQSYSEAIRGVPPPGSDLPEELQGYHTLVPLDKIVPKTNDRRRFGNWLTSVYLATSTADGAPYVLRRVENFRLMHHAAFVYIEKWKKVPHPSIVSVCEAFTTRAFGDNSLVVVYAYHPNARTLSEAHGLPKYPTFQPHHLSRSQLKTRPEPIPERTLWSYIVQIASAIKAVHDAGMAVRTVEVTKVLLTGQNRIHISSCAIIELLTFDIPENQAILQLEDLNMFGRLIFDLVCNNAAPTNGREFHKDLGDLNHLPEIKALVLFMTGKGGPQRNIGQVLNMIRGHCVIEMEDALSGVDRLQNQLMGELENARLVRLLCKFGFINERPEFAREPRWSETGDRYIIKLFRDYVFHQVDQNGNPVVNLYHVLTCLNKLDAGTEEKIMLVSRDEQSCLVVSYHDIKQCIDSAFSELARGSSASAAVGYS